MRKRLFIILALAIVGYFSWKKSKTINFNRAIEVGEAIDSLNGVIVYYNGGVAHVKDRNLSKDGYNIGMRWQCVEFIKRYYYQYYHHKMPDTYGHAKHFFDASLEDGGLNKARNLIQLSNPSADQPTVGEILVIGASWTNKYGHVAIISKVSETEVEIIQQNSGPFGASRITIPLFFDPITQKWMLQKNYVKGRLKINEVGN